MSEKILITGGSSKIGLELKKLISKKNIIYSPNRKEWDFNNIENIKTKKKLIISCNKIIILHSIINNKSHLKKKYNEILNQINVNLLSIIEICEIALNHNPNVKILIMGSESGLKGSFDLVYALTKSSIHKYVEERKILKKKQQLICLAPSTIMDAGITLRRRDHYNVLKSINKNPKKRGLKSKEVSKIIFTLMFKLTDYITNTVIHVNGGKFSRM